MLPSRLSSLDKQSRRDVGEILQNLSGIHPRAEHDHPVEGHKGQGSHQLALSPSTVTNLTRLLLQRSLISETEHGVSRGGRKPVLLQFNHRGGVLLGAEIAYEKLSEMADKRRK